MKVVLFTLKGYCLVRSKFLFNFFIKVYLIIVELNDVLAMYFNPFILLNFLHCLSTFQSFNFFLITENVKKFNERKPC